jgi:DNA-binding response OmpR family regulator
MLHRTLEKAVHNTSGGGGIGRSEILFVDDDRDLGGLFAFLMEQAHLVPLVATEPASAMEFFDTQHPAVAVIDLNLRSWDGFELLAELRRRDPRLPIIVLTGRNDEDDKVRALEMGADDYIVKPFSHRELVARVRTQARRAELDGDGENAEAVLEVGPLRLDVRERLLCIDGKTHRLTSMEFRLMLYLMRSSDSVVPTATLAREVWGSDDAATRDGIRVTLHRLRRKLGDRGPDHGLIRTVPGVGLELRARSNGQVSGRHATP